MARGGVSPEAKQAEEDIRLREQFTRLIGRLDEEQLGRAIVLRHQGPEKTVARQTDAGIGIEKESPPEERDLCGYSLAMNEDDSRHLVIFRDGTILAVQPQTPSGIPIYKNNLSSTDNALRLPLVIKTTSEVIQRMKEGIFNNTALNVTHINTNPKDAPQFDGFFDQAISICSKRKTERDQARRTTMQGFVTKFDNFLNPRGPENPPPGQLPPESPPPKTPPQG